MLTLTQIISEADLLVPNTLDTAQKVLLLNELNNEFFEVVPIPAIHNFVTVAGQNVYALNPQIRSNKVGSVIVGNTIYESMQYENVRPGHNFWVIESNNLTLSPSVTVSGQPGVVKYTKIATSTFTTGGLTVNPDAPGEYHWIYVLGLCELLAKAMNDVTLANNYGSDYRAQLSLAQQNYGARQKEG